MEFKMELRKFPSIEQLRHVIQQVKHRTYYVGNDRSGNPIYDETRTLPTLKFVGSVKLHGTNAGIAIQKDEIKFQSRTRFLGIGDDNAGFKDHFKDRGDIILKMRDKIAMPNDEVVVYGEWCGKGIQKGVAINELEKSFVIFASRVNGEWIGLETLSLIRGEEFKKERIFNILDYELFEIEIDFNNPSASVEELERLTLKVEKECPVGKAFGHSGVGEGIVWICENEGYESSKYWFKTKGSKHKATKNKKIVQVDVEKMNSVNEFITAVLTDSRLEQGLEQLTQQGLVIERKNVGKFIQWVQGDVIKEESDTLEASGLTGKDINKSLSNRAKNWFFAKINLSN